jgi:invasion protein IalB
VAKEADSGDNPPDEQRSRKRKYGQQVYRVIRRLGAVGAVAQRVRGGRGKGKGKVRGWEMMCQPPAGETATERCALTQTVKEEDKGASNLGIMIEKLPESNTPVLRVVAPLSVYLLNGVSLKIDQIDIGRAAFFRCSPAGCIADVPIDDKLLEQLKGGKIATLVIYLDPTEGLRHLFRLEGFKEGYEKIR